MRPRNLSEFVGQDKLLAPGGVLRTMMETEQLQSFILWGPPGVGKTTLARLLAHQTKSKWIAFSAVTSGIKEIKAVMTEAEAFMNIEATRTLLFVASTKHSRMPFFLTLKMAPSFSSVLLRKIHRLKSTPRYFRD
jgi:putative ATPase